VSTRIKGHPTLAALVQPLHNTLKIATGTRMFNELRHTPSSIEVSQVVTIAWRLAVARVNRMASTSTFWDHSDIGEVTDATSPPVRRG
jgi:hypothetical protein